MRYHSRCKNYKSCKDMCVEYLKEKKGIIGNRYLKMDIEDKFRNKE